MRIGSLLVTNLLLVLVTACATTEDNWQEAKRCGTVECLERFLSNNSETQYTTEATRRLTQAREERARDAESTHAWAQAGEVARSSRMIEVRTWKVEPCWACQSVEKGETITVTTETPTIGRILELIRQRLSRHQNPEVRIEIDRSTSSKLRLRAYGLKREIIAGSDYWEYIYYDVSLAKAYGGSYEVSLTLAGNFKAGGQPAAITGYGDMLTSGYAAEMNNYASSLVSIIKSTIEATERRSSGIWDW